ncbi:MAG: TetR/AcrR family transcriptional regulator [Actinomycetota bacterium]
MTSSSTYHHGDLPNALRAATAELIGEVGPTAFSLREVARRAGVSHAAPAHHFRDKGGLILAVAIEGFERLSDALGSDDILAIDDPVDRLAAQGRAYVEVAVGNPGHFAVMFRPELYPDRDTGDAGAVAFGRLTDTITLIRDQLAPDLDVMKGAMFVWSMVQGLVGLSAVLGEDGKFEVGDESLEAEIGELIEQMSHMAVHGLISAGT